jgi:hypothetical protein
MYVLLQNQSIFITNEATCRQYSNAVRCKELSHTLIKPSRPKSKLCNPKRIVRFFLGTEYHSALGWIFFPRWSLTKQTIYNKPKNFLFLSHSSSRATMHEVTNVFFIHWGIKEAFFQTLSILTGCLQTRTNHCLSVIRFPRTIPLGMNQMFPKYSQ